MRGSWLGDVTATHGNSSHVLASQLQFVSDIFRSDVEDCGWEESSIVVDLLDDHLVAERSDLQLVQQSALGAVNLEPTSDNLLVSHNFDLSLHNLGLDLERLEESSLLRVEASGAGSDPHIIGSDDSYFGRGFSLLVINQLLDLSQVPITKYEACVALHESNKLVELVARLVLILPVFVVVIFFLRGLHLVSQSCLHQGLLLLKS